MGMADQEDRRPVILIVEDEALLRMTLADHLDHCGFVVLEASSAHHAIDIINATPQIDVVLTDVKMPGTIDGFGLAKWMRENHPQLAVFVASGYTGKTDLAQELCGNEEFFAKPYDVDIIAARIKTRLACRQNSDR